MSIWRLPTSWYLIEGHRYKNEQRNAILEFYLLFIWILFILFDKKGKLIKIFQCDASSAGYSS